MKELLGLILGHLMGNHLFLLDWVARNKANPHPGPEPYPGRLWLSPLPKAEWPDEERASLAKQQTWQTAWTAFAEGRFACRAHSTLYTLAVWACSFWWMPWWGLVVCWTLHYAVDRGQLARRWTELCAGRANPRPGSPGRWTIVAVDNALHLLVLFAIAAISLRRV